jgi:endonuclease III
MSARRAEEGADSSDHARLEAAHPDAKIALRYRNEVELLVAVMHSAQTTDVKVNRVTEALVEKYRRPRTSSPDVVASVAVVLL